MGEMATDEDIQGAEDSIINGTVDNGDPAVVMLRSGNSGYCTGTLVSPTVVVTAAHCVDGITASSVGFGVNGQSTPAAVSRQVFHPNWNGNNLAAGYDIAVLILANPVTNVTPIPVSTDLNAGRAGQTVRIVGYGNNRTAGTGFGTKREATLAAASISASDGVSESRFVKVGNSAGTQTCNGDSGGPVFHRDANGVERVVGVTSFGYVGCQGGGFHSRVAAYGSFLDDYIDLTGGGDGDGDGDGDSERPSISLVSPANGGTATSGRSSVVFNATDNVGVSDVTLNWAQTNTTARCSAPPSGWTCTRSGSRYTFTANIGTGARRFNATATDAAGNSTTTSTFTVTYR